jgi:hypothetical protein
MSSATNGRQRGAVLLLLLALLAVGAATLLISALNHTGPEARRVLQTSARLGLAGEALIGFATHHGRLPRPASGADGREMAQPCDSEASCTGFLPWATLGIDGSDAWGKLLRYSVTPVFTRAPIARASASASKTIVWRDANGRLRYLVGQADCQVATPCAPAVVLSHGKNNFGTSTAGVLQPNNAAGNLDEASNAAAERQFISRVASAESAAGGQYDDIVSAVPLALFYKRLEAATGLPGHNEP